MSHYSLLTSNHVRGKRSKKEKNHRDPGKAFRQHAAKMAKSALETAAEWVTKKELGWAIEEAQRAVKLLEIAR
jgi:hypothetical protein